MKSILALFAFAILLASCKKEDPVNYKTYPLHIKYSRLKGEGTKLVISDSNTGEVLYDVGLPWGPNEFIGTFSIREDLMVDTVDMHIISPAYDYGAFFAKTSIESYAGIPIGTFVHFSPFEFFPKPKKTYLNIGGVHSFDTLTAGYVYQGNVVHDPVQKNLYAEVYLGDNYGCLLRVRANNSSDFKYYFLPDTLAGDTLQLNWADFKQETDLKSISLPSGFIAQSFRVEAVSPDFSKSIAITRDNYSPSNQVFNLPDILPVDWLLHVRVYSGGRVCEHMFSQQEPLVFHSTDLMVEDFKVSGNQISVTIRGDADWISMSGEGDFRWEINGAPETFKKIILPDLSAFLAPIEKQSSIDWNQFLLKQFDQHKAEDIRAGIPMIGPGFYPIGQSGYHNFMIYW